MLHGLNSLLQAYSPYFTANLIFFIILLISFLPRSLLLHALLLLHNSSFVHIPCLCSTMCCPFLHLVPAFLPRAPHNLLHLSFSAAPARALPRLLALPSFLPSYPRTKPKLPFSVTVSLISPDTTPVLTLVSQRSTSQTSSQRDPGDASTMETPPLLLGACSWPVLVPS